MLNTEVIQRFTDLEHRVSFDEYNYDHFHSAKIGLATGAATILILGARRFARAGKPGSRP